MKKNKSILANAILIVACLLLNVVSYCVIRNLCGTLVWVSALAMIPLGSIISSLIGGRVPGILTTILSAASFWGIDHFSNTKLMTDWRFATIALAATLICATLRYSQKRQKLIYNIAIALIISLVNTVVNYGYWKHVCNLLYSVSYDLYIIIFVPLIADMIIVLACYFFTRGYRSRFISYFDTSLSISSNSSLRFPIGVKLTAAISVVVISLVTVALLNNSKTFYDRIAYTMDREVDDTVGAIVEPYNPGDIAFTEAWESNPAIEKERLAKQIAQEIENNTTGNTIIKAELVNLKVNEDYELISAKVIGTFLPYDPEDGYQGASGIRYDDTEKSVDLNGLVYGDVHGWSFESEFYRYVYLDEEYNLCLYMHCREVEDLSAYAYNQLILSLVVAMLVGSLAVLGLEVSISIPLKTMSYAAAAFVNVDEIQREKAGKEFEKLDINSQDEVGELYRSFEIAMADMFQYTETIKENEAERSRLTKTMLDQSIETLAYTIDAKDKYTKGHSSRVAKYSRMIAKVLGKSEEECREVYLAGLLHDIGKIAVNGAIINKPGGLTDEEFEKIKNHPVNGAKILEKMKSIPFLQDGARYHHERYDGRGYPSGLKGTEIPELARIIAVADAYDTMASCRSYRPTMDQSIVKQEIWKGMGTQFDPKFAKAMISLIDADVNYKMREIPGESDEIIFDDVDNGIVWPSAPKEQIAEQKMMQETDANTLAAFICIGDDWCKPVDGIRVTDAPGKVDFRGVTREDANFLWNAPAILIYASDNGKLMGPNYDELGVLMSAGYSWRAGSGLSEQASYVKNEAFESWDDWCAKNHEGLDYVASFHLDKNVVVLRLDSALLSSEMRLMLPEDFGRDVYIAITGDHSNIVDVVQS